MPSFYYQKAANCTELPSAALAQLTALARTAPISNKGTAIILQRMRGRLAEMDAAETPTAQVMGSIEWWVIIIAEFPKGPARPKLRERCIEWVRECYKVIQPYAAKDPKVAGAQKQYWSEVLGDIYGENQARLAELKQQHDPANMLVNNRNIEPR